MNGERLTGHSLVEQTGDSASQAKVFKTHAVPQCVCENLINALKLLANQQKDGDSPIQSIVTGLIERSRKGIMEHLRNFVKVDNLCALEVGPLQEGTRSIELRRPKFEKGCPEVSTSGRSRGIDAQNRRSWLQKKKRAAMSITLRRTGGDRLW